MKNKIETISDVVGEIELIGNAVTKIIDDNAMSFNKLYIISNRNIGLHDLSICVIGLLQEAITNLNDKNIRMTETLNYSKSQLLKMNFNGDDSIMILSTLFGILLKSKNELIYLQEQKAFVVSKTFLQGEHA